MKVNATNGRIKKVKQNNKTFEVGEKVWCGGDSGFCHPGTETIKKIVVRYDSITGKGYSVIVLEGNRRFDGRTGCAINPPYAYYIRKLNKE